MSMMSITSQLLVLGATRRLEELNKERDYLIKLIDKHSGNPVIRLKKFKKAKRKWTAARRAKFMATIRKKGLDAK